MTDKIGPALSKEEWTEWRDRDEVVLGLSIVSTNSGGRPGIHADGTFFDDESRHALAALCLYSQPFGFSHEDVRLLRSLVEREEIGMLGARCTTPDEDRALESLASRIANLLPPEDFRAQPPTPE